MSAQTGLFSAEAFGNREHFSKSLENGADSISCNCHFNRYSVGLERFAGGAAVGAFDVEPSGSRRARHLVFPVHEIKQRHLASPNRGKSFVAAAAINLMSAWVKIGLRAMSAPLPLRSL
jgi:hypothetical protein